MRNCNKTCNIATLSGAVYKPQHWVHDKSMHGFLKETLWRNGNQQLSPLASGTPSISPRLVIFAVMAEAVLWCVVFLPQELIVSACAAMHSLRHSLPSFVISLAPFVTVFLIYFSAMVLKCLSAQRRCASAASNSHAQTFGGSSGF